MILEVFYGCEYHKKEETNFFCLFHAGYDSIKYNSSNMFAEEKQVGDAQWKFAFSLRDLKEIVAFYARNLIKITK